MLNFLCKPFTFLSELNASVGLAV